MFEVLPKEGRLSEFACRDPGLCVRVAGPPEVKLDTVVAWALADDGEDGGRRAIFHGGDHPQIDTAR